MSGRVSFLAMRRALQLIDGGDCDKVFKGGYACLTDETLSPNAQYTADRWCHSCTAHAGLTGDKRVLARPALVEVYMPRREFSGSVYAEIVLRASPGGIVTCEGCGLVLGKKPYNVDHTIPDALFLDKSRKLTAADGKLLGVDCCHRDKTKKDVADIAEAKRRFNRDNGIRTAPPSTIKSAPPPRTAKSHRRDKHAREQMPMPPRQPFYRAVPREDRHADE